MADNPGFRYAYGWNIYYEKLLGLWPGKDEGLMSRNKAWAWALLIFACLWTPQIASLSVLWGDLNSIIDCLSTNMTISVSIAKIVVLQYQRKVTGAILDKINGDWIKTTVKEDVLIMLETARISRFISILSVTITSILYFYYIIPQVWSMMKNSERKYDDMPRRLADNFPYESYFPFETKRRIIFIPLYFGQCLSAFASSISYAGPDSLVSMMVLHLCGQLRVVRHSLKNLINEITTQEPQIYWQKLTSIVKKHEELNQLGFDIKEAFSFILLVQMLACTLIFCFQGYAMFTGSTDDENHVQLSISDLIFSMFYGIYTGTHLFIYCYVGDRLLVESTSIPNDFYESPWYNLAPKEAKAFIFVCQRSVIPLELKAGKFCTFNLQLFNTIMRNSMGYLSMLMAMKERLID